MTNTAAAAYGIVEIVAKALATVDGHEDVDHLIVCNDGSEAPVWRFFVENAERLLAHLRNAGFVVTKAGSSDFESVLENLLAFPSSQDARSRACDLLAAMKAKAPAPPEKPAEAPPNLRKAGR